MPRWLTSEFAYRGEGQSTGGMPGKARAKMPKIKSRSDLFKGQMVEKPKCAIVVGHRPHPDGQAIYACPGCGEHMDADECDVLGAEPGCVFCTTCSTEFEL